MYESTLGLMIQNRIMRRITKVGESEDSRWCRRCSLIFVEHVTATKMQPKKNREKKKRMARSKSHADTLYLMFKFPLYGVQLRSISVYLSGTR